MKKLKTFNQLFEADIKDNKGVPSDYLIDIEQKAKDLYGNGRLSRTEFEEMMRLFPDIMRSQQGHEAELTEIGKQIIMEQYGHILDGVELDLKIVGPNDSEKMKMVNKMINKAKDNDDDEENEENEENYELPEAEFDVDMDEVDKRKILNNIMQGESQNIHTLLYTKQDEINQVSNGIIQKYLRFLDLNAKIIWDSNKPSLEEMMKHAPQMANAVEVNWKKKGNKGGGQSQEEGQSESGEQQNDEYTPTIKVRALDLTMILHETVKGIYELIMANAIPSDPDMAKKIIEETDTIENEEQDIKYGPFIAADLRDYINGYISRKFPQHQEIPNLREFIYGKLVEVDAKFFLEFFKMFLSEDFVGADNFLDKRKIVKDIIKGFEDYNNGQTEQDITFNQVEPNVEQEVESEVSNYAKMSKSQLTKELDNALDSGDYEKVREIQKYM